MSFIYKLTPYLWSQVFQYLSLSEFQRFENLSPEFHSIFLIFARDRFHSIHTSMNQAIESISNKLKTSSDLIDESSIRSAKCLMLLRYVSTKFNILYATIWKYSNHDPAWSILVQYLVPIFEESEDIISSAINLDLSFDKISSIEMVSYDNFFNKFDTELEKSISSSIPLTEFEVRVIDTLLSCPSIIFQMSLKRPSGLERKNDIFSIFKMCIDGNVQHLPQILQELSQDNMSDVDKMSIIIKYLRKCIENENILKLEKILGEDFTEEYISSLSPNTIRDQCLEIQKNPYEPIYRTTYLTRQANKCYFHEHYQRSYQFDARNSYITLLINIPSITVHKLPLCIASLRSEQESHIKEEIILHSKHEDLRHIKSDWYLKVDRSVINISSKSHIFHLSINYQDPNDHNFFKAVVDVSRTGNVYCNIVKKKL